MNDLLGKILKTQEASQQCLNYGRKNDVCPLVIAVAFTPPAQVPHLQLNGALYFFPYNHHLYEFHFFTFTFLTTQSVTHTTQHRMIQLILNNGEVVAYFQRIYRNNLKELKKITETRYQNSWHRAEIWTWNLRDMKLNCHQLQSTDRCNIYGWAVKTPCADWALVAGCLSFRWR